jgi:divinyl protochlorophyllide a 8-vinyl-reductase
MEIASTAGAVVTAAPSRRNGRIGPNAIIRVAEALQAFEGAPAAARVFRASGIEHYLTTQPERMVAESDVIALHRQLQDDLGEVRAASVAWIAGQRTADYLLANRIPNAAQRLLRTLPPRIASRLLLKAIASNAWTFAGTGSFAARHGNPAVITISNCPICRGADADRPICTYYAATFERLYAKLVHPDTRVVEITCTAQGADACRFEVRW